MWLVGLGNTKILTDYVQKSTQTLLGNKEQPETFGPLHTGEDIFKVDGISYVNVI
jgi:hypothetical protein